MDLVTIRHPDPKVGDARVPASAVDHWRSIGWLTEEEYTARQADTPAGGQPGGEESTGRSAGQDDSTPDTTATRAPRRRKSSEESA